MRGWLEGALILTILVLADTNRPSAFPPAAGRSGVAVTVACPSCWLKESSSEWLSPGLLLDQARGAGGGCTLRLRGGWAGVKEGGQGGRLKHGVEKAQPWTQSSC